MDNGINAKMRKRVPELKSEYAAYPMNYEGNWPKPPATAPDGNKLFVKSPPAPKGEAKELKDDYVWGPGTYGFGYYHLLTKDAYKILEARLAVDSAPTVGCGGCFGKGSSGADEYDPERRSDLKEIHHIVYFRSQSPVPRDGAAKEHAMRQNAAGFRPNEDLGVFDVKPGKMKL